MIELSTKHAFFQTDISESQISMLSYDDACDARAACRIIEGVLKARWKDDVKVICNGETVIWKAVKYQIKITRIIDLVDKHLLAAYGVMLFAAR